MEPAQQYSSFLPQVMEIQKNLLALADRPAELVRYVTGELRQITGARCVILVGCPDGTAAAAERRILGMSQAPQGPQVNPAQIEELVGLLCHQEKAVLWHPDDDSAVAPILRSLDFGLSHGIPLVSRAVRVGGLFLLGLPAERDFIPIRDILRQLISIVALALHNAFLYEGQERLIAERTRQLEESNAALRKSQEKLRAFFEADLFGSHAGTIHGEVFEANDEFLRTVGYTRQDLEAGRLRWTDITPPEYLHMDEINIAEAQAHGSCRPYEKEYIRKDGSRVWVLVGFILIGEKLEDSVVFTLDIGERKKETERLETILNNIPVMIDYFDASGKLEWGNRCWEETLGWPLEEAKAHGGTLRDHYPDPDYRAMVLDWIHKADGQWRDCLTRTRDGRMLDTTWTNIRLSDGSNIGIGHDTTDRKHAEDALRASEEKLRAFFNSNLFGTLSGDIYGHIEDANDEFLQLVGYSRPELEAGLLCWDELTPPEYLPLDEKAIAEAQVHGTCTPYEKQFVCKNGSRIWVLVGFILFGEKREKSAAFILDIGERRKETERLQAILDNIPVMIDHFDSAGNFVWGNRCWEQTLGWTLSEALARGNILEEVYPDPSLRRGVVQHIHLNAGGWKDSPMYTRDGRVIQSTWAEVRLSDGSIYGIGQDISERKRAELALRESEKRYRLISENSADVIWTLDLATWRFTYVSPSVYRLRGYTPEEVMAQPVAAVMTPDSYRYIMENMPPRLAAFAAGDESVRSLTTIVQQPRRDGSIVTTEVATTLVADEEGHAVELLGVSRDISERLRIEADRRAIEERFTSFMDHLPVMAFIKDQESRLVYLNLFSRGFYGWGPEMLGRKTGDLVPGAPAEMSVEDDYQALAGERVEKLVRIQDGQGEKHVLKVIKFPIGSQDKPTLIGGLSIDLTEQVRAEEEVRQLNAQLEQRVAERTAQLQAANRELEAFSYSVSHDLRAPLRAIDGFSRILLEDFSAGIQPEALRFLGLVRANTQQMGQLVDDLLAFSRLNRHSLHRQHVEPAVVVRHVLEEDLAQEQAGRQVEIITGDLPTCLVDPPLLKQVYMNLLANALKFTRHNPVARIEVGFTTDLPSQGQPGAASIKGAYFVRDNGVGFDMRFAHKLFTAFQRLHRAEDYEGTGIGLAIVQRIISRHGGRIWTEARIDQGATFFFTLPEGPDDEPETN